MALYPFLGFSVEKVENLEQSAPKMQGSQAWSVIFGLLSSKYSLPGLQSSLIFHSGFSHAVARALALFPTPQTSHLVLPRVSEYSPTGHEIQLESLPYFPKSHWVHSEAPDALYVPSLHGEHSR